MALPLRRALLSFSATRFCGPSTVLTRSSIIGGCAEDSFHCDEEEASCEAQDRPACAPSSEVPSTSYTPSPALPPFFLHRAAFHHAAFRAAAGAAAPDPSGASTLPAALGAAAVAANTGAAGAVVPTPLTKDGLWRGEPMKHLTVGLKRIGGRNNTGRITIWHRGGGHKRLYRVIDFKRQGPLVSGVPAMVQRIEYDPNRNAHIALIRYVSGHVSYILAPEGLRAGDAVTAGQQADIKPGNALPLGNIPRGTVIHNIELTPGRGGQLVRAAGASAQLIGQVDRYTQVRLQSGEMRMILAKCMATVGSVSNANYHNISWGKAGKSRWLGWRPTVRGVAMNPVDHPHGGGEGKTSGGRKGSMSPWAKPAKGGKTRNKKKASTKLIMTRRKKVSARQ